MNHHKSLHLQIVSWQVKFRAYSSSISQTVNPCSFWCSFIKCDLNFMRTSKKLFESKLILFCSFFLFFLEKAFPIDNGWWHLGSQQWFLHPHPSSYRRELVSLLVEVAKPLMKTGDQGVWNLLHCVSENPLPTTHTHVAACIHCDPQTALILCRSLLNKCAKDPSAWSWNWDYGGKELSFRRNL